MEICQAEWVMGELVSVALNQERVVSLCELPNDAAGDLHLPIDQRVFRIPYLLVKKAYLCVINN